MVWEEGRREAPSYPDPRLPRRVLNTTVSDFGGSLDSLRSLGMTERREARAARREGGGIDILTPSMNYRNELFSRVFHLTRGMRR